MNIHCRKLFRNLFRNHRLNYLFYSCSNEPNQESLEITTGQLKKHELTKD